MEIKKPQIEDSYKLSNKEADEFLKTIDISKFEWVNDSLQSFQFDQKEILEKYRYFITTEHQNNQKIKISSIVGTDHEAYSIKESWLSMLYNANRMNKALDKYNNNPNYYFSQDSQNKSMSYVTLNGKDFYITNDGNHRSTIAKFVLSQKNQEYLYGVTIIRYNIDYDFYESYKRLEVFCKKYRRFSVHINFDGSTSIVFSDEKRSKNIVFYNQEDIDTFLKKEDNLIKNTIRTIF